MRYITAIALGTALLATASVASPPKKFAPAPPPAAGEALLYIFRPGVPPLGARAVTFVDDVRIADFPTWGYTYVYLKPGAYVIRTRWPNTPELVSEETFSAGETYALRLANPVGLSSRAGTIFMIPSPKTLPDNKDERDLAACNYIVPQVKRLSRLGSRKKSD
jgi:hypothetical protein